MSKPYRFVRFAHWILIGFAYVFGVLLQGILGGLVSLVMGGTPVELLPGATVPVRLLATYNLLIGAPITFIVFHGLASALRLLLDLQEQVSKTSRSTS